MNLELKQDLTEFLRLVYVEDIFITQFIDEITELFEAKGEWADGYLYLQEKGILPSDPNHDHYDDYFNFDEQAFLINDEIYPDFGFSEVLRYQALCSITDWKFDAEDLEDAINSMLQKKIKLNAPAETYNDDLYPYALKALAPRNYTLCNYWNGDDACMFMIFTFDEYKRIKEIARKWKISIWAVDDQERAQEVSQKLFVKQAQQKNGC